MSFADRIRETVTFTGTKGATATITLPGSASTGYDPFSRRYTNGTANIPVVIAHRTADEWQACLCTYTTTNTLTVNSIVATSDAADAAVNFSNGDKDIYVSGLSTSFLPPLTSGQFVVGNASNVPVAVAPEIAASRIGIFDCVKAFSNQIDVEGATIPSTIDHIRTAGYYQAGDNGGALYKRVSGTPASPSDKRYITSSGSVYWEFAEPEVNIRQFGAKGDDSTDDTTAVQHAINYGSQTGKPVVVPSGKFKITAKLARKDASNGNTGSLVIRGHGPAAPGNGVDDTSALVFTAVNGGIEWQTASSGGQFDSLMISNVTLVATYAGITDPAINCIRDATQQLDNLSVNLKNVYIRGDGGHWTKGIRLNNCSSSTLADCVIAGTSAPPYGMDYGIQVVGNSIETRIQTCSGGGATRFIEVGGTCEGVYINSTMCINSDTALYAYSGGEPGFYITDSHFNTKSVGFDFDNAIQVLINNCLLYNENQGNYTAIKFGGANSRDAKITNNIFEAYSGQGAKTGGATWKGLVFTNGTTVDIVNNQFANFDGNNIEIGASCSNFFLADNRHKVTGLSGVTLGTPLSAHASATNITSIETTSTSGSAIHKIRGTASAHVVMTDATAATNTKSAGFVVDAQTMLVRQYNDDDSTKFDAAYFGNGQSGFGGGIDTEALRVAHGVGTANRVKITGAAASNPPLIESDGSDTNVALKLQTKGTGAIFLDANVGVGTGSFGTSADNVLAIANGTAPSTSPTGVGQLYVTSGELKYRSAGGTVSDLSPLPVFASGTYTPTVVNVSNVTASAAQQAQYMRVGNSVIVSGMIEIDPTVADDYVVLRLTLPVATSFVTDNSLSSRRDLAGTVGATTESSGGRVISVLNSGTSYAEMSYLVKTASPPNAQFAYIFMYRII